MRFQILPSTWDEWKCLCGEWNKYTKGFCSCGLFWQRTASDPANLKKRNK